jgi:hypothetical protein
LESQDKHPGGILRPIIHDLFNDLEPQAQRIHQEDPEEPVHSLPIIHTTTTIRIMQMNLITTKKHNLMVEWVAALVAIVEEKGYLATVFEKVQEEHFKMILGVVVAAAVVVVLLNNPSWSIRITIITV